jgi:hypothetical protein
MAKGHSAIGGRRARVCEGEELDPSRVDQISWCQVVRVLNRPPTHRIFTHVSKRTNTPSRVRASRHVCQS